MSASGASPASRPAEGRAFVRAEDMSEDFSLLESSEVLRRLVQTDDKVVRRKAALVLGDRHLAGTLKLSAGEMESLQAYIDKQIELTAAPTGGERVEANDQIRRLWRLTANKLLDGLATKNLTIMEACAKNLTLMRDAKIVADLIARIEASQDASFRKYAIFTLGMMRDKRDAKVPGRVQMGDAESEALARDVIIPFLTRLEAGQPDMETQKAIKVAFQCLKTPLDTRPRRVDSQPTQPTVRDR